MFSDYQQELENLAQIFYQSQPRPSNIIQSFPKPQQFGLEPSCVNSPEPVSETPDTILQIIINK